MFDKPYCDSQPKLNIFNIYFIKANLVNKRD